MLSLVAVVGGRYSSTRTNGDTVESNSARKGDRRERRGAYVFCPERPHIGSKEVFRVMRCEFVTSGSITEYYGCLQLGPFTIGRAIRLATQLLRRVVCLAIVLHVSVMNRTQDEPACLP